MDFKIIENGVVVEENGFHIFVPKHMLDTINNEAQKEWYYKQDVVDYLKEHYNYALLAEREPEIINELVDLYAGLRKINEGCFKDKLLTTLRIQAKKVITLTNMLLHILVFQTSMTKHNKKKNPLLVLKRRIYYERIL